MRFTQCRPCSKAILQGRLDCVIPTTSCDLVSLFARVLLPHNPCQMASACGRACAADLPPVMCLCMPDDRHSPDVEERSTSQGGGESRHVRVTLGPRPVKGPWHGVTIPCRQGCMSVSNCSCLVLPHEEMHWAAGDSAQARSLSQHPACGAGALECMQPVRGKWVCE
jgi:hypothetical protein